VSKPTGFEANAVSVALGRAFLFFLNRTTEATNLLSMLIVTWVHFSAEKREL
jgi:hypothetical protein